MIRACEREGIAPGGSQQGFRWSFGAEPDRALYTQDHAAGPIWREVDQGDSLDTWMMGHIMGMIGGVVDIRADITMGVAVRFHGFDNGPNDMRMRCRSHDRRGEQRGKDQGDERRQPCDWPFPHGSKFAPVWLMRAKDEVRHLGAASFAHEGGCSTAEGRCRGR